MKKIMKENKCMSDVVGAHCMCPNIEKYKNINRARGIVPLQQNSAITLIALIITIIVLLILAGVTLNMVIGDSGIFSKANIASEETKRKQAIETVQTSLLSARMEYTLNKDIEVKDFVEKENKEIQVEQTGTGEPLDSWEMTYNGYIFQINDLKIIGIAKGKNNPKVKNLVVTENYQFATTAGNYAKVEFEVELPEELKGATVTVASPTSGKAIISTVEYKDGKYTGTITTNGTDNPNGEYAYEIKATKEGEEKTVTAIAKVEKFLNNPTIEISEENIKYNAFTIKVTSNLPTEAGIKYKYYVTNTTANFETVTTKEITGLTEKTTYNVKVEAYLADETTYKEVTTTVTTPEKLIEIDSIEDLEKISEDLASSYKLTKNLDFKDRNSYETQEKYEYYTVDSNGDGYPDNMFQIAGIFTGTFDGRGYKMYNFKQNSNQQYAGLFYWLGGNATIKNLLIKEADIKQNNNYGGVLFGQTTTIDGSDNTISFSKVGITGQFNDVKAGGSIGSFGKLGMNNPLKCENCYSLVDITTNSTAQGKTSGSANGGFFGGQFPSSIVEFSNCYFGGIVSSYRNGGTFFAKGNATLNTCYYNSELDTSGILCYTGSAYYQGNSLSTEQMKNANNYDDSWDFTNTWSISSDINDGFPELKF